jgi:hypothetical protein
LKNLLRTWVAEKLAENFEELAENLGRGKNWVEEKIYTSLKL